MYVWRACSVTMRHSPILSWSRIQYILHFLQRSKVGATAQLNHIEVIDIAQQQSNVFYRPISDKHEIKYI